MECMKCKYYESCGEALPGFDVGYCHRFPPVREEDDVYQVGAFHIIVDVNDWCGEFEVVK